MCGNGHSWRGPLQDPDLEEELLDDLEVFEIDSSSTDPDKS